MRSALVKAIAVHHRVGIMGAMAQAKSPTDERREKRLAEALRENLRRRKEQARAAAGKRVDGGPTD